MKFNDAQLLDLPKDADLEPIESAIIWVMNNKQHSMLSGYFAKIPEGKYLDVEISLDELVSLHMARMIPDWATHVYFW